MKRIELLRLAFGNPMIVSSAARCPKHNIDVSETGENGPHTTGRAIDFSVSGADARKLVHLAIEYGFTGIGVNQKGDKRFVHVDDLADGIGQPRPWIWTY